MQISTQTNANGRDKTPNAIKVAKPKKATRKVAKPRKAKRTVKAKKATRKVANRGGGKALPDFKNSDTIRVLKAKEIARGNCFRTGQTVAQCITAQGKAGFHGRRKYVRKQIALGRISLKRK